MTTIGHWLVETLVHMNSNALASKFMGSYSMNSWPAMCINLSRSRCYSYLPYCAYLVPFDDLGLGSIEEKLYMSRWTSETGVIVSVRHSKSLAGWVCPFGTLNRSHENRYFTYYSPRSSNEAFKNLILNRTWFKSGKPVLRSYPWAKWDLVQLHSAPSGSSTFQDQRFRWNNSVYIDGSLDWLLLLGSFLIG